MSLTRKIIVLRFSAMGDVAMVASVLKELVQQNPDASIVMVSRPLFAAFFADIPNLTFHPIHPKTVHRGVFGLFKLFRELKNYHPFAIADIHDNLRSRILATFFRLTGVRINRIDKGRAEKKALTRSENKVLKPLKQTVERYADVFRQLGFKINLSHQLQPEKRELPIAAKQFFAIANQKYIGISPFAQHIHKVYPLNKMEIVVQQLNNLGYQLFIFGGGSEEQAIAEQWQSKYTHVKSLIGTFNLKEELAIISNLDLMLSMDSSGMHMASLVGVPVVSVWGPTHPYAGFLGYGQHLDDCLQIDSPNRPNSIYGNKPCLCGVEPCIGLITPTFIVEKLKSKLNNG